MNNALALMKEDLQRHAVTVVLPGESNERTLFLIMISALTSKLKDFEQTYGSKATATHLKVARKIFGENETENVYGVFVDENLQMVFAFNRDFADYGTKKIIFRDMDDVLLDKIEAKESSALSTFPPRGRGREFVFPRCSGPRGLIKYSLAETQEI